MEEINFEGLLSMDAHLLEPGQMVIWEAALRHLEEQLEYLKLRATHYGEYSLTKLDFIDMIDDLAARARNIRKTNQGEA